MPNDEIGHFRDSQEIMKETKKQKIQIAPSFYFPFNITSSIFSVFLQRFFLIACL